MKWGRSTGDRLCGFCAKPIAEGAPVLAIALPHIKGPQRYKWRGECCAGPAPPDLPLAVEDEDHAVHRARSAPMVGLQSLARKWK